MSDFTLDPNSLIGMRVMLSTTSGDFDGILIAANSSASVLWDEETGQMHIVYDDHLVGATILNAKSSESVMKFINTTLENIRNERSE